MLQTQFPLTEENIRIVAKRLIQAKGSFKTKDLYPFFNVVPAREAVADCVKPLGYIPSSKNKQLFVKKPKPNPNLTIKSVILPEEQKENIRLALAQEKYNELIFETWGFGQTLEKGTAITLLFWGPSGTGKTLMAQAIAEETGSDLRTYDTADIESSIPGEAERKIKQIFADAKITTGGRKQIILFDECDSLLTDRNTRGPILGAQVNVLLGEIENHTGIIIFTTNRLGKLDSALIRRIITKIEFPFPNEQQRYEIWKRLIPKKAPLVKDVNIFDLSKYCLTGGNIKNIILTAARKAAYLKQKKIDKICLLEAIEKEMSGKLDFKTLKNQV